MSNARTQMASYKACGDLGIIMIENVQEKQPQLLKSGNVAMPMHCDAIVIVMQQFPYNKKDFCVSIPNVPL